MGQVKAKLTPSQQAQRSRARKTAIAETATRLAGNGGKCPNDWVWEFTWSHKEETFREKFTLRDRESIKKMACDPAVRAQVEEDRSKKRQADSQRVTRHKARQKRIAAGDCELIEPMDYAENGIQMPPNFDLGPVDHIEVYREDDEERGTRVFELVFLGPIQQGTKQEIHPEMGTLQFSSGEDLTGYLRTHYSFDEIRADVEGERFYEKKLKQWVDCFERICQEYRARDEKAAYRKYRNIQIPRSEDEIRALQYCQIHFPSTLGGILVLARYFSEKAAGKLVGSSFPAAANIKDGWEKSESSIDKYVNKFVAREKRFPSEAELRQVILDEDTKTRERLIRIFRDHPLWTENAGSVGDYCEKMVIQAAKRGDLRDRSAITRGTLNSKMRDLTSTLSIVATETSSLGNCVERTRLTEMVRCLCDETWVERAKKLASNEAVFTEETNYKPLPVSDIRAIGRGFAGFDRDIRGTDLAAANHYILGLSCALRPQELERLALGKDRTAASVNHLTDDGLLIKYEYGTLISKTKPTVTLVPMDVVTHLLLNNRTHPLCSMRPPKTGFLHPKGDFRVQIPEAAKFKMRRLRTTAITMMSYCHYKDSGFCWWSPDETRLMAMASHKDITMAHKVYAVDPCFDAPMLSRTPAEYFDVAEGLFIDGVNVLENSTCYHAFLLKFWHQFVDEHIEKHVPTAYKLRLRQERDEMILRSFEAYTNAKVYAGQNQDVAKSQAHLMLKIAERDAWFQELRRRSRTMSADPEKARVLMELFGGQAELKLPESLDVVDAEVIEDEEDLDEGLDGDDAENS